MIAAAWLQRKKDCLVVTKKGASAILFHQRLLTKLIPQSKVAESLRISFYLQKRGVRMPLRCLAPIIIGRGMLGHHRLCTEVDFDAPESELPLKQQVRLRASFALKATLQNN